MLLIDEFKNRLEYFQRILITKILNKKLNMFDLKIPEYYIPALRRLETLV